MPLKSISAEAVAEALLDIYSRLGVPHEILSDMGAQFVSECTGEVSRLLNIRNLTTTPYHLACYGLVETFSDTLKTMLRRFCVEQPRQWNRYTNALLFTYREAPQEPTGFAPFELSYGRSVTGQTRILRHLWTKEDAAEDVKTSYQYVFELRERIEDTVRMVREELDMAQSRHKAYFDRRTKRRVFTTGDQVLVLLHTHSNKLLMR